MSRTSFGNLKTHVRIYAGEKLLKKPAVHFVKRLLNCYHNEDTLKQSHQSWVNFFFISYPMSQVLHTVHSVVEPEPEPEPEP